MKKHFLLLCATIALFSCQKSPELADPTGDAIRFTTEINTRVKDNLFEDGDQITVAAFADQEMTDEALYSFSKAEGVFNSDEPIVKSVSNKELSYSAIFPALDSYSNEFNFSVEADQNTEDAYEMSDLLVASVDATEEDMPKLLFDHKLSSVILTAAASDGVELVPSKVVFNAKSDVACNIANDEYVGEGEVSEIIAKQNEGTAIAILAPQTFEAQHTLAVVTIDDVEYPMVLKEGATLVAGSQYTCKAVINPETQVVEVEFTESLIEDWTDGGELLFPDDSNTFSMELVDLTVEDIVVHVNMGEYEGVYYVGISSVGPEPETAARNRINLELYTHRDLTVVDNKTLFNTSTDVSIKEAWGVYPNANYMVFAVGVDAEGNFLTDVVSLTCTVPDIYKGGSIALEAIEVGARDIKIKGTPTPDVVNYSYGIVETEMFYASKEDEGYEGDAYEVARDIQSVNRYTLGVDPMLEPDGKYLLNGECIFNCSDLWPVSPETDYTVVVYGIHESGTINSDIATLDVTTKELVLPSATNDFEISVNSAWASNISVDVNKGSWEGSYYVAVATPDMDPLEAAETVIAAKGDIYGKGKLTPDGVYVFGDNATVSVDKGWKLIPYTEYQIIAFGITEYGEILTNVASVVQRTTNIPSVGSIALDVTEVGARDIKVKATPESKVGKYIYGLIKTDIFNMSVENGGFANDPYLLAQSVSATYLSSGFDLSTADGKYVLAGESEFNYRGLWLVEPETEYTAIVFGVNKKGYVNTDVAMEEVTTTELVVGDRTTDFAMSLDYASYYNMAVTVDKGSWEGNYYVGLTGDDGTFKTDEELARNLIDYELYYEGTDLSVANGVYVFDENGQVILEKGWIVSPGVKYWIVGFAINEYGDICSNIASIHTETPSLAPSATAPQGAQAAPTNGVYRRGATANGFNFYEFDLSNYKQSETFAPIAKEITTCVQMPILK